MGDIEDAVKKIEEAVRRMDFIDEDKRTELLRRLKTLKSELARFSKTHQEHSRSIAGFAQMAAQEVARKDKAPHLLQNAIDGLALTVKGFESSHPKLTQTVNEICTTLAQIGI